MNPALGGVVEALRLQQRPLTERGVHVEIATCDSLDSPWLKGELLVHAFGPAKLGYGYTPGLLPWLRANRRRFDLVIIEGLWQYHGLAAWISLSGTSTPYYVFPHGMLDPWFKNTYPLKHLKKSLYWPWAEYRVLRDARKVIFTCDEERLSARKSFGLYRANEAVMALGVEVPSRPADIATSKLFEHYPLLQGKRVVLFMGRLHEKKGCDLLIAAFARIAHRDNRLHLLMAGPDQTGWISELKNRCEQLGIGHRVTWPGMLRDDEKWGAIYASEVFCLPSHHENFGIVVAEALACGKPVLISSKVNIWREIEADGAGFVDDDSVDGTERNLNRWLNLDHHTREQMAERARRCFSNRFHVQRAAERLLEIIRENTQ